MAELTDGGAFAELAPVGDAEGLAAAVLKTLDAPRDENRLKGRAALFSLDAAADHYLDLLLGSRLDARN